MLSQQKGSLLRDKVRLESVTGKNAFFDQIGSVTATVRSTRHSDTPQADTPHSRRRVSLVDYEFADLVDDLDKVRMLVDPTSSYAQAAAYAMGRAMDDAIITAALGSSDTGVAGGTAVALPAGQKIVEAGTAGLTVAKLRQAKEIIDLADVDPSLFDFCVSNRLAIATNKRKCIAFVQDGVALAVGKDSTARIDERSDKGYATQVYYSAAFGATRMEEAKVVEVQAHEA
jgi:hypothetical protein